MSDKKITDHVETLQLAIAQVQNPELREDASEALTALLRTWVQPAPDPIAEHLKRMMRDLENQALQGGLTRDEAIVEREAPSWWHTPHYEKDAKTAEFVKVYAQGRARNKALKHRP